MVEGIQHKENMELLCSLRSKPGASRLSWRLPPGDKPCDPAVAGIHAYAFHCGSIYTWEIFLESWFLNLYQPTLLRPDITLRAAWSPPKLHNYVIIWGRTIKYMNSF